MSGIVEMALVSAMWEWTATTHLLQKAWAPESRNHVLFCCGTSASNSAYFTQALDVYLRVNLPYSVQPITAADRAKIQTDIIRVHWAHV